MDIKMIHERREFNRAKGLCAEGCGTFSGKNYRCKLCGKKHNGARKRQRVYKFMGGSMVKIENRLDKIVFLLEKLLETHSKTNANVTYSRSIAPTPLRGGERSSIAPVSPQAEPQVEHKHIRVGENFDENGERIRPLKPISGDDFLKKYSK